MTSTSETTTGPSWQPPPRPEWVTELNKVGANPGSPAALVALDEESLMAAAIKAPGLDDFGGAVCKATGPSTDGNGRRAWITIG